MSNWLLLFSLNSPVGVGLVVLCLGIVVYLLMKANTDWKRLEEEKKEKKQKGA